MKIYLKLVVWLLLIILAVYGIKYINERYSFADMQALIDENYYPILIGYIVIISIRGILFIPTMPMILLMASSINHWVMLGSTLFATCLSTYCVCLAVDFLDMQKHIDKLPQRTVNRAHDWVQSYGVVAVTGWAFFPFVYTEVIVYLSRLAGLKKQQILLSVAIGEGMMLAILIYMIDWLVNLTL